jgi:hypothetical protein
MKKLLIMALISPLFISCSVARWDSYISPQCAESGWTEIKKSIYKCEFKCRDDKILVRSFPVETTGLFGPPLLPIIPMHIKRQTKLVFFIRSEGIDEKLLEGPLDIVVRLPNDEKAYAPIRVADLLKNSDVIREERLFQITLPLCSGPDKPCRSYLYKFDIETANIESFDIIFSSEFMGCFVPKMHYKKTKKSGYHPLVLPSE